MRKLLTLLLFFGSITVYAQVPQPAIFSIKCYGGNGEDDVWHQVTKTDDGGFIIAYQTGSVYGSIDSFCSTPNPGIIFQKYNSDASVLEWTRCITNSGDTFLAYMFPQPDSSVVFGGCFSAADGFYICKQNATGSIIWSHSYSTWCSLLIRDMIKTDDGGYLMYGEIHYTDINFPIHYGDWTHADLAVMKLDSAGNKVFSKVFGGTNDEMARKVLNAPDSGFYIIGTTYSNDYDCTGNHGGSTDSADVYILRLNKNGNIIWHRDFGGTAHDFGEYAYPDGRGGVLIGATAGSHNGNVAHKINVNNYEIWVLDIDSNGIIVFENCFGGGEDEKTFAICQATDNSIWIAGYNFKTSGVEVDTAFGNYDAWFVHADSVGNFINSKVIGTRLFDQGNMIYPLSNGNVIAGGSYDTLGNMLNRWYGGLDAFLVIFTPFTTNVIPTNIQSNIYISPNPANSYFTINIDNCNLKIMNTYGSYIYSINITNNTQIQVRDWKKGLYILEITDETGYKTYDKLIIQ